MTEDELKQFGELAAKYEPKDKDAVTKLIQAKMHPVFQDINDGGRSAANADNKTKIDGLTAERDTLKTRAEKAENDLKELEGKAPEVGKLREKFENELKEERRKFGEQLVEKDNQIIRTRLEVARQKLVDKLADKHEIDREYAGTVIVQRQDVADRLQVEKDSPTVKVLKAGSKDMFIVPADGKEPLDHLAEELAVGIDDKWKGSKVRKGTETQSRPGSAPTEDRFKSTRERAKAHSRQNDASKESGSGLDRLSGRRPAKQA